MSNQSTTHPWQVSCSTLSEMFHASAKAYPERVAFKSDDVTLTYAQAAKAIAGFARALGPQARGRTVVLVLPNGPQFLVAYYGVLAAGASPALVNYAHPDATVTKLLAGLDIAATFSDRTIPGLEVTHFDAGAAADLALGDATPDVTQATGADSTAAILFSGGTTGLPKQIAHTNAMLIKAVERMEWGWPTSPGEVWLPVAPFTHVYGFLTGVLNSVLRGGTIVMPARFHPDLIVDMLSNEKVTVFGGGPPAIYQAIMASDKFTDASFPDLRVCPGGGAPFPLEVHRKWHQATGLPITEGYGMTEIAPICVNTESDGMLAGAAGKPAPDTVVEIVDIQTGQNLLPTGETGEVRVKGPHMMTGYKGNPEETAIAIRDGYVYTGDIGMLNDDGFLILSDRKKDVIFVKGFNVFPREVEETLLAHPSVSGACVVGRKDARAGEVPVAYVTVRSSVTPDQLTQFLKDQLSAYKIPADIVVLEALPMTPAAKVDRTSLREKANQ